MTYKERICVIVVSDASYHQEECLVIGEMIKMCDKENRNVSQIYWKSGVIRKVCTFPKAAETQGVMKVVDDAVNSAQQIGELMNAEIDVRIFTDSRLLLEILESTSQVAEKGLRPSVAYLKQCLEDKEVGLYAWIEGKDIVADMLTKQGSR